MNEFENNEVGKVTKIGIIKQKRKENQQDSLRVLNMESQSRETFFKKPFLGPNMI